MIKRALVATIAATLVGNVAADNLLSGAPDEGYAGNVDLGVVRTTGNSETETVNGEASIIYRVSEPWATGFSIGGFSAKDGDDRTAERYFFNWDNRITIDEKSFWFTNLEYEDDRFSGFDYQAGLFGGYGYEFYRTDDSHFLVGVGAGMRRSKFESGETEDEAVLRGSLDYRTPISDYAEFTQLLTLDVGEERNIARSESALSAKILEDLSLKIAYVVKYTSDVPPGFEKTDTTTTIGLSYKF